MVPEIAETGPHEVLDVGVVVVDTTTSRRDQLGLAFVRSPPWRAAFVEGGKDLCQLLLLNVPHAATVAYVLLPFEFAYWIGFALPFGPPLGIARTILLLLA